MKSKTLFKIMLDVILLVLYCQLMFCYDLSPLFHEVAGMAIGVLFILHVVVNWKPVRNLIARARKGQLSSSRLFLLASDIVLPFGMLITIVSGMLIATEVWFGPGGEGVVLLHNATAYVCLAILVFHTVLHAKYLVSCARQFMHGDAFQRVANSVGALALVFALLGGNVFTGLLDAQSSLNSTASAATTTTETLSDQTSTDSTTTTATTTQAVETTGKGRQAQQATVTSSSSTDTSGSNSTVSSGSGSDSATEDTSSTPTNCTLCGRNCPLSSLRCSKGTSWAQSNGYI